MVMLGPSFYISPRKPLGPQMQGPTPKGHQQKSQGKTPQFIRAASSRVFTILQEKERSLPIIIFEGLLLTFLVWLNMMVIFVINLVK